MNALVQKPSECSLASIATLNELSQKDYNALSRLVRERTRPRGCRYGGGGWSHNKALRIGVQTCVDLGLFVPPDYANIDTCSGNSGSISQPDWSGRGIVRVKFVRKRCRKWSFHVITFKDGVFYESAGISYPSWDALAHSYAKNGSRDLTITRIFR